MKKIDLQKLTPNTLFMVNGNITFCRVTSKVEGEELEKADQRRVSKGLLPVGKSYTTVTICNAQVVASDPKNPTLEERYANENLFISKSQVAQENGGGYSYSAMNKGRNLPWIGVRDGDTVREISPKGELATGLNVTLVMKVFQGKPKNGIALEGIIVNEEIRYNDYSDGAMQEALQKMGLVFQPMEKKDAEHNDDANDQENTVYDEWDDDDENKGPSFADPGSNPFSTSSNVKSANTGKQGITYDAKADRNYAKR